MASKKSKLDLLVRVRYLNPLPAPPIAPKLLTITTDINRLGEPSYLDQLASSTPLPMLVDAEMGMPLNLNAYEGVWDGDDLQLNPTQDLHKVIDPVDLSLLAPLRTPAVENASGKVQSAAEVSWMRNSSYITRKNNARRREAADAAERADAEVDASEAAQLAAIDLSFHDFSTVDAKSLKHPDPKKKALHVIEDYPILPDDHIWGNQYILVRYPEKPVPGTSLKPNAVSSTPLLANAVLRPIREEEQQIMDFYLPDNDDVPKLQSLQRAPAEENHLKQLWKLLEDDSHDPRIDEEFPNVPYSRVRSYDVVSQDSSSKEVLLAIQEQPSAKRRKGAYFKDITMKTLLRKTRVKRRGEEEVRPGTWDKARVLYRYPSEDDAATFEESAAPATDAHWAAAQLRYMQGENAIEGQGEAIDEDEVIAADEGAERAEAEADSADR